MAWYHASFETNPQDKSRSTKVARLFRIRKEGGEIEFPSISCAGYVLAYMQKIGFPMPSEGYIKHSEIQAWASSQGLNLHPDEHQMIFDSFIEYNSKKMYYESKPHEPAPFTNKTEEEVYNENQQNMAKMLKGMVK